MQRICNPLPFARHEIIGPFGSAIDKFNLKWHFPVMEKISMLEIRRNARSVIERLHRGESFTITYRNRAVGELRPIEGDAADVAEDAVYDVAELAEDLGGGLDARKADELIYGT